MGKKKNSTRHTSPLTRDNAEPADQESISTYSSDTASVPLDRTPPLALSPGVDGPAGFADSVFTILHDIKTQLGAIESRLSKWNVRIYRNLKHIFHLFKIPTSFLKYNLQQSLQIPQKLWQTKYSRFRRNNIAFKRIDFHLFKNTP